MPFLLKMCTPLYHRGLGPPHASDNAWAYLCPMRWCRRFMKTDSISNDHYQSLELKADASPAAIKEAYYRLSKLYHPDVSGVDGGVDKFRSISAAYEVLGDPAKKAQYDAGRRASPRDTDSYRYSGNAEYRGGPRRSPNAYGMPRERTQKEYDEWIHQQQNLRHRSRTASDRAYPGSGLWYYFWGSIAAWITCSVVHWFERTRRRALKENARVGKDE